MNSLYKYKIDKFQILYLNILFLRRIFVPSNGMKDFPPTPICVLII